MDYRDSLNLLNTKNTRIKNEYFFNVIETQL